MTPLEWLRQKRNTTRPTPPMAVPPAPSGAGGTPRCRRQEALSDESALVCVEQAHRQVTRLRTDMARWCRGDEDVDQERAHRMAQQARSAAEALAVCARKLPDEAAAHEAAADLSAEDFTGGV